MTSARSFQLAPLQSLNFGERDGTLSDRVRAITAPMARGQFGAVASEHIIQEMWEKWVFLAALAARPCLMRGSVGNILRAPGGRDFILGMFDECCAITTAEGHAPGAPFLERARGMFTAEGSQMTASMFPATSRSARALRPIT